MARDGVGGVGSRRSAGRPPGRPRPRCASATRARRRLVDVEDGDARALLAEQERDGLADAGAAARHDRDSCPSSSNMAHSSRLRRRSSRLSTHSTGWRMKKFRTTSSTFESAGSVFQSSRYSGSAEGEAAEEEAGLPHRPLARRTSRPAASARSSCRGCRGPCRPARAAGRGRRASRTSRGRRPASRASGRRPPCASRLNSEYPYGFVRRSSSGKLPSAAIWFGHDDGLEPRRAPSASCASSPTRRAKAATCSSQQVAWLFLASRSLSAFSSRGQPAQVLAEPGADAVALGRGEGGGAVERPRSRAPPRRGGGCR